MIQDGNTNSRPLDEARARLTEAVDEAKEALVKRAGQVQDKVDDAIHGAGESVVKLAAKIDSAGPAEGKVHDAVHKVAEQVRSGGDYLSEQSVDSFRGDLTRFVRRHPLASISMALGVGFLIGITLVRRH